MAALQVNGLGDTVATTWRQISKAIPADTLSQVESQLGVTLPGELQLILGQSLTIALPKQDLTAVSGADLPTVGIRDLTSDGSRVGALLTKISQLGGADNLVKHGVDGNTIYLATTD